MFVSLFVLFQINKDVQCNAVAITEVYESRDSFDAVAITELCESRDSCDDLICSIVASCSSSLADQILYYSLYRHVILS